MSATFLKGRVHKGHVETDQPINLPDGTPLLISVQNGSPDDVEEGWDTSPEAIADWLKWCDSLQPLRITAEEQAEWDAWLTKMNEHGSVKSQKEINGLFP